MLQQIGFTFILLLGVFQYTMAQDIFFSRTGHIHIDTHSSLMDLKADNYQVAASLDSSNGEIVFTALIKSFSFDLGLADRIISDERINVVEKPKVYYKGNISNVADIDYSTPGIYQIKVDGILYIWGMERITGATGTVEVQQDGSLRTSAKFKMTIEEESMNKVNSLMKEHLPTMLSVDANKLGISRDIFIETNMTLKKR